MRDLLTLNQRLDRALNEDTQRAGKRAMYKGRERARVKAPTPCTDCGSHYLLKGTDDCAGCESIRTGHTKAYRSDPCSACGGVYRSVRLHTCVACSRERLRVLKRERHSHEKPRKEASQ